MPLGAPGPFVYHGTRILVKSIGSLATTILARVVIMSVDQKKVTDLGGQIQQTTTSDRTAAETFFLQAVPYDGFIVDADVTVPLTTAVPDVKRGQIYVSITRISPIGGVICQGYVYAEHNVTLGEKTEPGPGGGEGFLSWVAAFTGNRAGNAAAVALSLASTSALKKVYGVVWFVICDATVATRTVNRPELRGLGGATPTGYTAGNSSRLMLLGPNDLTLTASEQGTLLIHSMEGKDGIQIANDTGTLTIDSSATRPSPFPFFVDETETNADINFPAITTGQVGDLHSAYVRIEEWLVI